MSRMHVKAMMTTALLFVAVSCGGQSASESSDSTPSRSLESTIAAAMQGAQLDVWGGGAPAPGGTTSLFVHRGDRAAEVYWTTDGWCLARLSTWTVEHAVSATRFDVRYSTEREFTGCVAGADHELVLRVYDATSSAKGSTVFGAYPDLDGTWTTRTRCVTAPGVPAACGFEGAMAALGAWV